MVASVTDINVEKLQLKQNKSQRKNVKVELVEQNKFREKSKE